MAAGSLSSIFSLYYTPRSSLGHGNNASVTFNFRKSSLTCLSSKNKPGFVDQILDYIEGGPKLRKWYGAPDRFLKDGSVLEEDDKYSEKDEVRDAVLVTDGDDDIGQMIILSLIVKRTRVKALVKDKRSAVEAFGTYVEPMAGDTKDKSFQKAALRGVRAIICPKEGFLSQVESLKGVEHVIVLSQLYVYRGTGGIQALMNGKARKLAEEDESIVMASGIPYTVIRAGSLQNTPGGKQGFSFTEVTDITLGRTGSKWCAFFSNHVFYTSRRSTSGSAAQGRLSKEDAAFICMEALDAVPQRGLVFEVVNGEEKVSNWKECFAMLMEKGEQQLQ